MMCNKINQNISGERRRYSCLRTDLWQQSLRPDQNKKEKYKPTVSQTLANQKQPRNMQNTMQACTLFFFLQIWRSLYHQ